MMHPKYLSINEFTYDLTDDRIAYYPLKERHNSKLLIFDKGIIGIDTYKNLADYLPPNSLVVFNDAKVIPARILFQKPTGGMIEIFCLEPYGDMKDYSTVMNATSGCQWKCMIGGAGKWKSGPVQKTLYSANIQIVLQAHLLKKPDDAYVIEFEWSPAELTFAVIIELAGAVPLPPYIKRQAEASDKQTYQTIYAQRAGSVAAPTAGLHISEEVFESFHKKNIQAKFVTLHVSAGTFKPVKAATMRDHQMHAEWIDVDVATLERLASHTEKIVAVGTTAARTLETLYWMGSKASTNPAITMEKLSLGQWEVYEEDLNKNLGRRECLQELLKVMKQFDQSRLIAKTQLMIAPGYTFKMIDSLITNFHQPASTLLLLVAAAAGHEWKKIYAYALENEFRFLSYGDGSLIHIN